MEKTKWKEKVKNLKKDTYILYLALKSDSVPWYSKLFIGLIVGYAFSPIDLIPDFIPVLGYVDDMILLPLGIILAFKMIPSSVIEELRAKVDENLGKKQSRFAAAVIVFLWILLISAILDKILR